MRLGVLAVVFLLATAMQSVAYAQHPNAPDALNDTFRCVDVQDDQERLACYDQTVRRLRTAQNQGEIVTIDREQAASLDRESFGFSLPNLSRLLPSGGSGAHSVDAIEARVEQVMGHSRERHRFVLSNGQIWDQTEPQRTSNVRVGDTVTIRRAALGSFLLSSSRGGAAHRVRRVN